MAERRFALADINARARLVRSTDRHRHDHSDLNDGRLNRSRRRSSTTKPSLLCSMGSTMRTEQARYPTPRVHRVDCIKPSLASSLSDHLRDDRDRSPRPRTLQLPRSAIYEMRTLTRWSACHRLALRLRKLQSVRRLTRHSSTARLRRSLRQVREVERGQNRTFNDRSGSVEEPRANKANRCG